MAGWVGGQFALVRCPSGLTHTDHNLANAECTYEGLGAPVSAELKALLRSQSSPSPEAGGAGPSTPELTPTQHNPHPDRGRGSQLRQEGRVQAQPAPRLSLGKADIREDRGECGGHHRWPWRASSAGSPAWGGCGWWWIPRRSSRHQESGDTERRRACQVKMRLPKIREKGDDY